MVRIERREEGLDEGLDGFEVAEVERYEVEDVRLQVLFLEFLGDLLDGLLGLLPVPAGEDDGLWVELGHLLGRFEANACVGSGDHHDLVLEVDVGVLVLGTVEVADNQGKEGDASSGDS